MESINLSEVKLGEAKAPVEDPNQTSTEDGGDAPATEATEAKPAGETASESGDDTGKKDTKTDDKPEKDVDYFKKFKFSSSEANRLLGINKSLSEGKITDGAKISQLKNLKEALEKQLKEKDPEGYDTFINGLNSEATASENADLKLGKELDTFIGKTKGAEAHREALKQHKLSNPDKGLDEIWNDHGFKAMAESIKSDKKDDKKGDNKGGEGESTDDDTHTEDGEGASTGDPAQGDKAIGGHSLKEFNKLSLSERKTILAKQGNKM